MPDFMTLNIKPWLKGISKLAAAYPELTVRAMYTASEATLIPAIKQRLRDSNNVFRGQLISRISTKASMHLGNPSITFGAHGVNYGMILERGTGPRAVSDKEYRKLVQYARVKLGFRMTVPSRKVRRSKSGSRGASGGGRLTRFNVSAPEVADAIKRSIESKGNIAHPFIMPIWRARHKVFISDFTRRLRLALGAL